MGMPDVAKARSLSDEWFKFRHVAKVYFEVLGRGKESSLLFCLNFLKWLL